MRSAWVFVSGLAIGALVVAALLGAHRYDFHVAVEDDAYGGGTFYSAYVFDRWTGRVYAQKSLSGNAGLWVNPLTGEIGPSKPEVKPSKTGGN